MITALRVLVSAYACEPGKGSEAAVGWNWACQIARLHETWVITRSNNRQAIESALAGEPQPNLRCAYFDLPRWARFWKKRGRGVRLYYALWQVGIYFLARRLHRKVGFDLVHHITLVNYWMPSLLAVLPVPFVLGPVGGGESAPRAFWCSFNIRGKLYEVVRSLRRGLGHLDPFVRFAVRRAVVAFATTSQTAEKLSRLGCTNVVVVSQVGINSEEIRIWSEPGARSAGPFRVISVGRLLHWKGFELGIRAFAAFKARFPASEYLLVGDGPERGRLEGLTKTLGLVHGVRFLGSMPRAQVLEKLLASHVLLNPSLHDSGGFVCVEAMATALPVICLDLGGPALQVTEQTGIRIPATSPQQVVSDLSEAMGRLAQDSSLRIRLGRAGQRRAEDFSWDKKRKPIDWAYGLTRLAQVGRDEEVARASAEFSK